MKNLKKKKTLQDYLDNWNPDAQHELVDWGKPVGKEIW
jgi:antitoxin component of MazEF toxin-antitoxin module